MDRKESIIYGLENGNSRGLAEFLKSKRKKIFFGQGLQAYICYEICSQLNVQIEAFIGSEMSIRHSVLPAKIPFYLVDEFSDGAEYDVLIAVNEKHNDAIRAQLVQCGFKHIYCSDNWNRTNMECRTLLMRHFLRKAMGEAYDEEAEILEWNGFKIWSGVNQADEYTNMLAGEFFDIIASSIFANEEGACAGEEGPYERGNVQIESDDVVMDIGAHIGMFSCVAASKGKMVYAFEPTPSTKRMLDQQMKLYSNPKVGL